MELALYAARRAIHEGAAEAHRHDMLEAGLLVGEAGEELANAELGAGRGAFLRHAPF